MNKLENARLIINKIDDDIRKLFEERMECVKDVIEYKIENNLPIFDKKREIEIITKNSSLINEEFKEYYIDFYKNLIKISKDFQKDILDKSKK